MAWMGVGEEMRPMQRHWSQRRWGHSTVTGLGQHLLWLWDEAEVMRCSRASGCAVERCEFFSRGPKPTGIRVPQQWGVKWESQGLNKQKQYLKPGGLGIS